MTSLKGDLRSIMGTPFGGVGHAVLIFSRVTRAAFNSDSVVLQLHDRIEMPEDADGKFQVDGLDPGPIRIELEGGTVHNHGWNIDLPDEGVWSLTDLVDAQVDWSPAVIGRAEAAAREARDHADRAEAGADRVGTAEQVGVWASEASSSASAAASARSAAQTARNASQSARDAAEGHADRAATSESNAAASESAAKQSEGNAGDYAAVATTAATEAVDAMESASDAVSTIGDSVSAAAGHATRASQSESGAAAYAQNASDAADRVGTAEQVGTWAQQAQDAADRIGTAETVEGWANSARDSASAAGQAETKAKEYRDAAFSAADSTSDSIRSDLASIATDASRSASRAKTSETNAATHEANSLSAAERAEFAAEETIQQVEGDFATRNYVDSHPRIPSLDSSPGLSWAVTDSEHAALAVTVTGEVDFGRLTDRAKRYIGEIGGAPEATAWVIDIAQDAAYATYLPTGQRIRVSDADSWIEASGTALVFDHDGKTMWIKEPGDGPWRTASVERFAWWGSSTMRGLNAGMFDLFASKGILPSNYFDGGIGSDKAAHILGRMGVEPFKLASNVTFPASQMSSSVYFEIAGVPPTASRSDTWGSWGDIYGRLSMIDSQWRFTPQNLSVDKTLPAGTEFTPDAATQFRDAVTIINIAKNDFVGEEKDAQFIFEKTKQATDWLRSLARHHLVFGHFSNNNWAAGDPRIAGIDEANRLCAEHYGARFIDLNAYILGEQVWTDAGIVPTADDLAAQERRVLPPSLSANANHFSTEFNLVLVDKLIRPALESKGWL